MQPTRKSALLLSKCLLGKCLTGAALAVLGLAAPAAQAQTAYVDTYVAGNATASQGSLVETFGTLDLQTGVFTSIGSVNQSLFALGFGSDGLLYGLGPDDGGGTNLYQVATGTGAETALQDFAGFAIAGGSGDADGTFTAITSPGLNSDSSLFTVDPTAGTATAGTATLVITNGLAVADGSGSVYVGVYNTSTGVGSLDVVNASAVTPLGDTGLNNLYTGLFSGGQLYTFGFDSASADMLEGIYTLDTSTGAATLVAATSNNQDVFAAALVPAAVPEAPTTVSFGLLLAFGGFLAVKCRKGGRPA